MAQTTAADVAGKETALAPHPGSQAMPRWNTGDLIESPRFDWRNLAAMIGPGLVMGGSAIGGGEWLTGPLVTARFGGGLLWLATLSILAQVIYNIEISRYTLYCGEPIFTGKFRMLPGPMFWIAAYLVLDVGSIFPYLASSAATPLAAVMLGHIPNPKSVEPGLFGLTDAVLLRSIGAIIFVLGMIPLIFGGKIYNSIKAVMIFKIFTVMGFLLFIALCFSTRDTWKEILTGFVKFGNIPVKRDYYEVLGVPRDADEATIKARFKEALARLPDSSEPSEQRQDIEEAFYVLSDSKLRDIFDTRGLFGLEKAGFRGRDQIDNVFTALREGRSLLPINLGVLGLLCAMISISGNGGLSNTPLSNYTRDQGWGMGHHVGAIPSVVGGHHLQLSHVGMVFPVNTTTLPRWRGWYWHLVRDQVFMWMPACFFGLALPSMLSVQFLPRGTGGDTWTAAGLTAGKVGDAVSAAWGPTLGSAFWFMTLFCGFLVLAPTMVSTADGVVRRWVDAFWTALPAMQKLQTSAIRFVYFGVLCIYVIFGLTMLIFVPDPGNLIVFATLIYNYALGFSCLHTLAVNVFLLPRELRPGWFVRLALLSSAAFFLFVAVLTTYSELLKHDWI